ncbi:MAG: hypothetical protein FE78DRAFT_136594 [Acidomyces sp. 'richmondensis']|nr:MAG: hypothetical protein FE78DRAFT_136594 [Acidomyces sp. 'richmondensis']
MDFEDYYSVPIYLAEALLRTLRLSANTPKPNEISVSAAHGSKEYQSHARWSQNEDSVSDQKTRGSPLVPCGEGVGRARLESIGSNISEVSHAKCASSGHGRKILPPLSQLNDNQSNILTNLDNRIDIRPSERICQGNDSRIFVALGSNVGNRLDAIESACTAIDEDPDMRIVKTSSLYETEPMYVQEQERFLNGVCEIESNLAPLELLDRLQAIEHRLGRVKTIHKGPRNIDLDILLYKGQIFKDQRLTIPHPLMLEREFVLRPLLDIHRGDLAPFRDNISSYLTALTSGSVRNMWPQTSLGSNGQFLQAGNPNRATSVMSILNVTPDSFSDGGVHSAMGLEALREVLSAQIADGAKIIDIGGQSSRPGAMDITAEEEISRILPAIQAIMSLPEPMRKNVAISVDTYRAVVAEAAIKAGAHIINDISAGQLDREMLTTVARLGCTYVMMHMRGNPHTMQSESNTTYPNGLIPTITSELLSRLDAAQAAGIRRWRIILDPGIGFSKTDEQNVEILRKLPELVGNPDLGNLPWLVGSSRKGFIGRITGVKTPDLRQGGTAATVTAAVHGGADIVRVHEPGLMVNVVKMADAMYRV